MVNFFFSCRNNVVKKVWENVDVFGDFRGEMPIFCWKYMEVHENPWECVDFEIFFSCGTTFFYRPHALPMSMLNPIIKSLIAATTKSCWSYLHVGVGMFNPPGGLKISTPDVQIGRMASYISQKSATVSTPLYWSQTVLRQKGGCVGRTWHFPRERE